MTDQDILGMLKVDLGITTTAYDDRLTQYITSSRSLIEREGVIFNSENLEDCQLNVMYAAWLWRKRDMPGDMPRALRYNLNNRVFSEKMKETNG